MTNARVDPADALWERADAERRYWDEEFPSLLEKYPDRFVAVHNREVIASALDLLDLLHEIERRGVNPRDAWVRFISASRRSVLL